MLDGHRLDLAAHQLVVGIRRLEGDLRQQAVQVLERLGPGALPVEVVQLVAQIAQPHAA